MLYVNDARLQRVPFEHLDSIAALKLNICRGVAPAVHARQLHQFIMTAEGKQPPGRAKVMAKDASTASLPRFGTVA